MADISVVIPAYNSENSISDCLTALENQIDLPYDKPIEVIVVDNGSTDRTAEIARRHRATLVQEPQKGASYARNAGIKAASGEIICFTDADCEPTPNWISALTDPLLRDETIIGGKGVYLTKQKQLTARFIQLEYEDKYDLLRGQEYIDFIDTYSAVYRRSALDQHGYFDPEMTYLEDQELSFRLNAKNCRMVFEPNAVVYHLHSDSTTKYFRKKRIIGYWKAQVVRKFPQHGVKDSHTPQVMKVQMGLVLLCLASCLLPFTAPLLAQLGLPIPAPFLALVPILLLAAFLLTTIPFIRKAFPKDPIIAFLSPYFLFIRALALSIGYIEGVLNPIKFEQQETVR